MNRFGTLAQLATVPIDLPRALTTDRLDQYWTQSGSLRYWYGTARVNDQVLDEFQTVSDTHDIVRTFETLWGHNRLNTTENRAATHIQLRDRSHRDAWLGPITQYCNDIHRNGAFDTVVQIGIGGSELGPRAAYHALKRWGIEHNHLKMKAKFIANLDTDDARLILSKINLKSTLFIVVSKSGGTLETTVNLELIRNLAAEQGIPPEILNHQLIAITTKDSPLDKSGQFSRLFYIDEGIGGRFSVTSAVGTLLLGLCFGVDVVVAFLDGACDSDHHARTPEIRNNLPLLSALLGIWDRTFLDLSTRAVIPYCEGLRFLPAHLQQLECESCGKRVATSGAPIDYPTSPMVFGHTGTQVQHSFFQNLHQGTDPIPVEFVGVLESQLSPHIQTDLIASWVGQISALALGRHHVDPRKDCPGNRPSTLVILKSLTPQTLGELIAYYENRTVFQGLLWGINPFDQEGVELGKLLCQQVRAGESGFPAELFNRIVSPIR